MRQKIYKKGRLFIVLPTIALLVLGFLIITGCDETGVIKPVVPVDSGTEPVEPPTEPTDPTTNGDVKKPEEPSEPDEPTKPEPEPEPEPTPEPAVAIAAAAQQDDGSITVSGTSTDVPAGTTVTVTLGDTVTATATTDANGNWTVTVPATEAETLSAGTVAVTAAAKEATADSSFEYTVQTTYGIPTPTEEDRVKVEIVADVIDVDEEGQEQFEVIYKFINQDYGYLFDLETKVGRETFKRFVEYDYKQILLERNPPASFDEHLEILDQYFEEAYGISADYARWLVREVYLQEKPEDEYLLGVGWQTGSIAMEHLLLRIANPNTTEEQILELLRESIRAGKVTIA